jgi:hypothetical protein
MSRFASRPHASMVTANAKPIVFVLILLLFGSKAFGVVITDLVAPFKATGTTYFVANGSDLGPGSLNQPWATINHAAEQLKAGDMVAAHGGHYILSAQVRPRYSGRPDAWISFVGYPGKEPILDAQSIQPPTFVQRRLNNAAFQIERSWRSPRSPSHHFARVRPWLLTYTANFARLRETDLGDPFVYLWSLAVEEQFYWIWPFAVFFSLRASSRKLVVAIIFLAPLGPRLLFSARVCLNQHHWLANRLRDCAKRHRFEHGGAE